MSTPLPNETDDAVPGGPRTSLGRLLTFAFLAFFAMVALGIVWVWQKSVREKSWREQVNATGAFLVPSATNR